MPTNLKVSIASANAALAPFAALANSGYIDLYTTTQPSTPETAPGGTSLVTAVFPATAFPAASGGVLTANAISAVTIANSGSAVWFRVTKSDHSTPIWDGSIGSGATNAWVLSTVYTVGTLVANGGNGYYCTVGGTSAGSGGPSGTGATITDNTVTWTYVGPAIGDMTIPNIALTAATQLTISSLTFTLPAY